MQVRAEQRVAAPSAPGTLARVGAPPRRSRRWPRAAVGRLSRAAGRGGGTTLPGKLLWKLDPGAIDALAARLPRGCGARLGDERQDDDERRWPRAILGRRAPARLEQRRREPRVGRRLHPARRPRARSSGCSRSTSSRCRRSLRRVRPRAVVLGNLFRDQLDRYGELEHIAERWRGAVARARPRARRSSSNADDPLVGDLARRARARALRFGVDDPRRARPALQHAADSKYCLRCGTPYDYAAAYVGHLGDYRCPACGHARPPLDVAARDDRAARPRRRRRSRSSRPRGRPRVRLPLPGLYNVYNALAAAVARLALGAPLEEVARRSGAASARRSAASSASMRRPARC